MIHALIFFVGALSLLGVNSHASDIVKLNSDEVVVKALTRIPLVKGSLTEVIEANKMILRENNMSLEDALQALSINPKNTKTLEGYTFNRWSVRRVHVSQKYELLIQFGLDNLSEKYLVTQISVIPHMNYLLKHKLSNEKNWNAVIFE